MHTRTRGLIASAGAVAALALTACVPPAKSAPTTTTPKTPPTTATPAVVPKLCSETGQAPADALASSAALGLPELQRGAASLGQPGDAGGEQTVPLPEQDKPPALSMQEVRSTAEHIASEPQTLPGGDGTVVAIALSSLVEGRPVLHTAVQADPAAAVDEVMAAASMVAAAGGEVVGVQRDVIVDMATDTGSHPVNDAYRDEQWSFDMFDFEDTWCASTGAGVKVAVVDSGVDADHPDLAGKVVSQVDMSLDPLLGAGNGGKPGRHGTHVAGTIAAIPNNSIGVAGVAPGVELLDVKALTTEGKGTQGFTAKAIVHAVDAGADVINLSVGFPCDQTNDGTYHAEDPNIEFCAGNGAAALEVAGDYAKANDVVMVVAAGNDGQAMIPEEGGGEVPNPIHNIWNVPGAVEWSLTVGSMTADSKLSPFSTQASYVDISGPGSEILSSAFDEEGPDWEMMSGTSMATPHVAGLVAVLRGAFPSESAPQVIQRVTSSAAAFGTGDTNDDSDGCPVGTDKAWCFGSGVIDPGAAVKHGRT